MTLLPRIIPPCVAATQMDHPSLPLAETGWWNLQEWIVDKAARSKTGVWKMQQWSEVTKAVYKITYTDSQKRW